MEINSSGIYCHFQQIRITTYTIFCVLCIFLARLFLLPLSLSVHKSKIIPCNIICVVIITTAEVVKWNSVIFNAPNILISLSGRVFTVVIAIADWEKKLFRYIATKNYFAPSYIESNEKKIRLFVRQQPRGHRVTRERGQSYELPQVSADILH